MFDLFGIGNALVDFECEVADSFITDHLLTKGQMYLKDEDAIATIKRDLGSSPLKMSSGGSAANTVFGARGFGLECAYCCRVQNDEAGAFFVREMKQAGIQLDDIRITGVRSKITGNCLVLVTDDAQRTMCTNLGISSELSVDDINLDRLKSSRYLYVEGYLAASETGSEAAQQALQIAKEHGTSAALNLSDVSMVNFFRANLEKFCNNEIDIVFCNEEEALCWAGTDRLDIAINQLKEIGRAIHITIGAAGSLISDSNGNPKEAKGFQTESLDTNGAGDMYAAAALSSIATGRDHFEAAQFGNYAAARTVSQYGARLSKLQDYQELKNQFGRNAIK